MHSELFLFVFLMFFIYLCIIITVGIEIIKNVFKHNKKAL